MHVLKKMDSTFSPICRRILIDTPITICHHQINACTDGYIEKCDKIINDINTALKSVPADRYLRNNYLNCRSHVDFLSTCHGSLRSTIKNNKELFNIDMIRFNNLLYRINGGPMGFLYDTCTGQRRVAIKKLVPDFESSDTVSMSGNIDSNINHIYFNNVSFLLEGHNSTTPWHCMREDFRINLTNSFVYLIGTTVYMGILFDKLDSELRRVYNICKGIMSIRDTKDVEQLIRFIRKEKCPHSTGSGL